MRRPYSPHPSLMYRVADHATRLSADRLDKYVGYKMAATGALIGEGGVDGVNVTT